MSSDSAGPVRQAIRLSSGQSLRQDSLRDIGQVVRADLEAGEVRLSFDGREVTYDVAERDAVAVAYATTVHKSQGSEYPAIVLPTATQPYRHAGTPPALYGCDPRQAAGGPDRAAQSLYHRGAQCGRHAAADHAGRATAAATRQPHTRPTRVTARERNRPMPHPRDRRRQFQPRVTAPPITLTAQAREVLRLLEQTRDPSL